MKKFILPLLLILAVGILAAVESAPSEVVGYVKYDCVAGNNFIALPMSQGFAMASEVAAAFPGSMDQISYYSSADQTWYAAVDLVDFWDGDFPVGNGTPLMINALNTFSFYSIGDMPAQNASYNLVVGLNSVMIPLNKSALTWASMAGMEMTADQLSYFSSTDQTWYAAVDLIDFWDGDFGTTIGFPLMANITASNTWPSGPRNIDNTFGRNNK